MNKIWDVGVSPSKNIEQLDTELPFFNIMHERITLQKLYKHQVTLPWNLQWLLYSVAPLELTKEQKTRVITAKLNLHFPYSKFILGK